LYKEGGWQDERAAVGNLEYPRGKVESVLLSKLSPASVVASASFAIRWS
jgi:hypothetical protein